MAAEATIRPTIELRLLGRFVVLRGGAEIPAADFGGRKVRALLRILAIRRGQFVTHDVLSEMLWPDRPPADPAANLQVLVNRARRATRFPALILTGPGGYALTPDPSCLVDAEQFLAAVAAGMKMSGRPGLVALSGALSGFGGEPLPEDRYCEWAAPIRAQVLRARQEALEQAAALAIRYGDPARAVEYASAAVAAEPLREIAAVTLTRALAAAGDQVAALDSYESYRRTLADELGLDPSPEAAALHAELLGGKHSHGRVTAFSREIPRFGTLPFVGRDAEYRAVMAALAGDPSAGAARVVTVAGASGSGKSRLIGEVAASLSHVSLSAVSLSAVPLSAVSVRAYWPDRSEPWSLARALLAEVLAADITAAEQLPARLRAALASIIPELERGEFDPVDPVDPESRRALVVEAAVRLIASMNDICLIVDDVQWADPTSLQLLAAVADRVPDVSMVFAYRPDEIAPDSEIATLLRCLTPANRVELAGLSESAIGELTNDPSLAAALSQHTDRTPLAVGEVLRSLARDGAVASDSQGRWKVLAPSAAATAAELGAAGQRRAIAHRVDRHSGVAGEVLRLLALLAREVPARTVAAGVATSEDTTLGALATLSAAGLARLGEQGWVTAHDMVGEVVAERLDEAAQGRLHGLVARALESENGDAAELARHWLRAGDVTRAAKAYASAAARALDAFADSEAESLAEAGLATPAPSATAAQLHEVRAQARRRRGDIAGARADLRAALAGRPTGPERAMVLAHLATLASGADDLRRASELVELAIVEAGDDPAARGLALEVAAVLDMNLARPERAADRAAQALALFQRLGDSRGAARILDARAMATFLAGDIRGGTALLDRAANLFEDSGDLMRLVTPRSTRGHGMVFLGRPDVGLADATSALEVARNLGHPEGQAYALWHQSEALSALGHGDEAVAAGHEALTIAQRIGHRGWTATAWRAIGIGEQSRADLGKALHAFRRSLELSENLDLFGSWARARAALVMIALRHPDDAAPLVAQALAQGPPLGHYEARLARVELAVARSDPHATALAEDALCKAEAGGAVIHRQRLTEVING